MPEDPNPTAAVDDPLQAIVAALSEGGPRTAGQLADYMNIPYSTLTPRLRRLEDAGRAERATNPDTRQMIWQLTPTSTSDDAPSDADVGVDVHDDAITQTGDTDDTTKTAHGTGADQATPMAGPVKPEPATQTQATPTDATQIDATQIDAAGPAPAAEQPDDAADSGPGNASDQLAVDTTANEPTTAPAADPSGQAAEEPKARRPKGTVAAEILTITRAHPDTGYKTGELSKATGISQGAIANAAHKLCATGELLLVCEQPATFQAA